MLKSRWNIFRLLLLFFTLTVSVPLFPCEMLNVHGLFGEIQTSVVVSDTKEEGSEVATKMIERVKIKGTSVFNRWLLMVMVIVCLAFEMCVFKLPREDTIVAKKVRMDR